jgi:hypothetical protein
VAGGADQIAGLGPGRVHSAREQPAIAGLSIAGCPRPPDDLGSGTTIAWNAAK